MNANKPRLQAVQILVVLFAFLSTTQHSAADTVLPLSIDPGNVNASGEINLSIDISDLVGSTSECFAVDVVFTNNKVIEYTPRSSEFDPYFYYFDITVDNTSDGMNTPSTELLFRDSTGSYSTSSEIFGDAFQSSTDTAQLFSDSTGSTSGLQIAGFRITGSFSFQDGSEFREITQAGPLMLRIRDGEIRAIPEPSPFILLVLASLLVATRRRLYRSKL